jgi:hypothetical protein
VETAAAGFRARLNTIEARKTLRNRTPDAEFVAICDGVKDLLCRAEKAARGQYPRHRLFFSWWRGTNIEAAFQNIHKAESELVRLYSDDEVDADVPEAVARTEVGLNRDHPMREIARGLNEMNPGSAKRTTLSKVIHAAHEAADRSYSRVRNFRNVLLATTLLIAVLVLIFSWVVSYNPSIVPFCFEPANLPKACPTGDEEGQGQPLWMSSWSPCSGSLEVPWPRCLSATYAERVRPTTSRSRWRCSRFLPALSPR